jgi:trk system potassium uptake protein TrkA
MKFLIVGCGRVGSALASLYSKSGHEVSVIDELEEAAGNLDREFNGTFFMGAGLDVDLLKEAGIEEADVCIAVTDGDNTNLVVSQIASKQFNVSCVVARVFDPNRATFFADRGINVVSPVALTIDLMHQAVCNYREAIDE